MESLPKLTELTLLSPIGGGGGTGGSTVFGLLLAAGLLFGIGACGNDIVRPSSGSGIPAAAVQTVTCRADVQSGTMDCAGPARSGPVTLGGQGSRVALRSTNVGYSSDSSVFYATVTVQNLLSQTLGSPYGGVYVFFQSGPDVTAGTGVVTVRNPSGDSTFTAVNQPYFHYADSLPSGQTTPGLSWEWNVPGTVTSFVFTVLVAAQVDVDQGVLTWSAVPDFASDSFVDLAVNSSTDAMAVGLYGRVLRKVGSRWSELPAQTAYDWVGVSAIGGGEYVGATAAGTVALFNGQVWNTVRNSGFNIRGITAYAANRIAIGGDSAGSPHLSWLGNSGWYSIGLGGGSTFRYLASYGIDQGVGATLDGSVYLFNFNSGSVSGSSSAPIPAFYGAISAGDFGRALFSGGTAEIYDQAAGFVYIGGMDTTVDAIDFGNVNPVFWAVVRNTTTDSSRLMSWNAGTWTDRALLPQPVEKMIQDSTGGLYLLSADGIRRWNGTSVVDELVAPAADYPTALAASGSQAVVGTVGGNIRRLVSGSWVTDDPDGSATDSIVSVQLAGNDTILVAEGQFVMRYDGTSWSTFGGPTGIPVAGMWAPNSDQAVVFLQGTDYVYRMTNPGDFLNGTAGPGGGTGVQLRAAWGTSINNFWLVGNSGRVIWYDSTAGYVNEDPGTGNDLDAVTGTSSSDVWVAGTNGYIAHWDGSGWTDCSLATSETIRSLWVSGTGVVYAGTGFAADTLYNLSCNVRSVRMPGQGGAVRALAGSSTSELWALVGDHVFEGQR